MIAIPLQLSTTEFDLFIVLEDDNLDRIVKDRDPAEICSSAMGRFAGLKIRNINILYASPDEAKLLPTCRTFGEVAKIMKDLGRGWSFRPEMGDNDGAYQAPGKN